LNYYDTFIQIADDSPVGAGTAPAARGERPTVALIQYTLLSERPYGYTQEEVLFETYLRHKGLEPSADERTELWNAFFARPQACLRASPLPKQYGWGVHFDTGGKTALYGAESEAYRAFSANAARRLKAMRSSRASRKEIQ